MLGVAVILLLGGFAAMALCVLSAANHPVGGTPATRFVAACGLVATIAGLAFGFVWLLSPTPAAAAVMACNDARTMIAELETAYGERRVGGGTISDAVAVEVFASPGGETFTVVAIDVLGRACIIAAGGDWEQMPVPFAASAGREG